MVKFCSFAFFAKDLNFIFAFHKSQKLQKKRHVYFQIINILRHAIAVIYRVSIWILNFVLYHKWFGMISEEWYSNCGNFKIIFIFYEIILLIWKNIKTIYKGEKVEEEPLLRISDTYNISSINLQEWKNKEKIST